VQASAIVTEEMVRERIPCGRDPERHLAAIQAYADAGYDEVHILQMGPDQAGMLNFYQREILRQFQ
jgi:hypothetical protein